MKLNRYLINGLLIASLSSTYGCREEFTEVNTNPSTLSEPDIRFLFTSGLTQLVPSDYWAWYYDYTAMLKYGQVAVTGGGNTNLLNQPDISSGTGRCGSLSTLHEIEYQISLKDEKTAASYQNIRAMMMTICTYMGITDTDYYGSQPYTEAYMARYGGTLMPKYDTQAELFDKFYSDLVEATDILANDETLASGEVVTPISAGAQDFIYGGDVKKWAKLANSLKLKIAVRLLHADREKAKKIAQEAFANKAGLMVDWADDLVYNIGIEWYNGQEQPAVAYGNYTMMNFLVDNKDPRVRFFFNKNDFNSEVVQAYFDADRELPSYIAQYVNYKEEAGKKVFDGWKAPGEPWVRYHGMPVQIKAIDLPKWDQYYDPQDQWLKLSMNGQDKYYASCSTMQLELYRGDRTYTYPTKPGGAIVQDNTPVPHYALYMSAGEVNLYLAELCRLGILSGNAASYFEAGVRNSVEGWNNIAKLNDIPYYSKKYDENEALIALNDGEIDELLKQPAYHLTGGPDDLEKIYLQMHFNFIWEPWEMMVTLRRTGVPMKNSAYLPFEDFKLDGSAYPLPRRGTVSTPSETDQMAPIVSQSYKDQGFSVGNDPVNLNTQRVWYDKGAPNYGEGPNY